MPNVPPPAVPTSALKRIGQKPTLPFVLFASQQTTHVTTTYPIAGPNAKTAFSAPAIFRKDSDTATPVVTQRSEASEKRKRGAFASVDSVIEVFRCLVDQSANFGVILFSPFHRTTPFHTGYRISKSAT
jgi:hypothetical protein